MSNISTSAYVKRYLFALQISFFNAVDGSSSICSPADAYQYTEYQYGQWKRSCELALVLEEEKHSVFHKHPLTTDFMHMLK